MAQHVEKLYKTNKRNDFTKSNVAYMKTKDAFPAAKILRNP